MIAIKGMRSPKRDAVKITYEPTDTPGIRVVKIESSLTIISFGEGITVSSVIVNYYDRKVGIPILFYDPFKDAYLKIAKIEGRVKTDEQSILKVENQIVQDTSFFYRFLKDKLPHIPPPGDKD